jgi:hypothetical protein
LAKTRADAVPMADLIKRLRFSSIEFAMEFVS